MKVADVVPAFLAVGPSIGTAWEQHVKFWASEPDRGHSNETRGVVIVGIIEDIQNIASHRSFGPWVFYHYLGPQSQAAWDELMALPFETGDPEATRAYRPG